jgi:hypothetical protein
MAAQMNRRDWLKLFSAGVVGAMVMDPEKLLWVPGEKTIFLPAVVPPPLVPVADYSLWQLHLRIGELSNPNEYSTMALQGKGFYSEWVEVERDEKFIRYENRHTGSEAAAVKQIDVLPIHRANR